jgi:DNA-binding CsgD family transcriptional regulator
VEVLRLVAQGLNDAQVADQFVISPRTVNTHLTSIYNKLGVDTRTAASRFAVDQLRPASRSGIILSIWERATWGSSACLRNLWPQEIRNRPRYFTDTLQLNPGYTPRST